LTKILAALVVAIHSVYLTRENDLSHIGLALLKNLAYLFKPSEANAIKNDDYLDSHFQGNVFSGKGSLL
jgi:hypothetical protein